jgi:hypothetical protein
MQIANLRRRPMELNLWSVGTLKASNFHLIEKRSAWPISQYILPPATLLASANDAKGAFNACREKISGFRKD